MTAPVPLERKRALGNPGKRALPDQDATLKVAPTTSVPQAPSHLSGVGLEAWQTVWSKCAQWVSPDLDTNVILRYCEHLQMRDELLAAVYRQGLLDAEGKPHPALMRIRDLDNMLIRAETKLALNPSDRASMGFIEIKKANALESFFAKQDASPEQKSSTTGIADAYDTDEPSS